MLTPAEPRGPRSRSTKLQITLEDVRFDAKTEQNLQHRIAARTPVSWRVKLLATGKVQLSVTCEEAEPATVSERAEGAVAIDVNADHLAVAHESGDGRLLGVGRQGLGNAVQVAVQSIRLRCVAFRWLRRTRISAAGRLGRGSTGRASGAFSRISVRAG